VGVLCWSSYKVENMGVDGKERKMFSKEALTKGKALKFDSIYELFLFSQKIVFNIYTNYLQSVS